MSKPTDPTKREPALFQRGYGGMWRPTDAATIGLPHAHTPTSKAAARSMRKPGPVIRERVRRWIAERGPAGATAEQVQIALALRPATAAARVTELAKAGVIRDTGRTRPTTSGRAAAVYVAAEGVGDG